MKATYGGPGFEARAGSHAEDLGSTWPKCGARSSVAPLKRVMLTLPPESLRSVEDAEAWHMERVPDFDAVSAAHARLKAAYEQLGVEVHDLVGEHAPPNLLFAADLFFMTAEGAVLGRMASPVRAGEEKWAAAALARHFTPVLAMVRGEGTFEGADALWLGGRALIGEGLRTNASGASQVEAVLLEQGVEVLRVEMPAVGAQHLLGVCTPVDEDLVLLRPARCSESLREALVGVECLELDEDDPEVCLARGNNLVAVAPREVLMPTGAPRLRDRLEAKGVKTHEVHVEAYLAAAGAIGCATGVLLRESGSG